MVQLEPLSREGLSKAQELIALIGSGAMSQAACVAAQLRIPDLLASGPKHVDEIARATGSHGPSLRRLLRALATIDLCAEGKDGKFALSPMGALLRSDTLNSLRSWALYLGQYQEPIWAHLLHSVKTGESARKVATGTDDFAHLDDDSEAAQVFNGAMTELTHLVAGAVVQSYDFAGARRVVDIGGGYGALLAAVLNAHPEVHGILFDRPHAIRGAKAYLANVGLAERCDLVAGNFLTRYPRTQISTSSRT